MLFLLMKIHLLSLSLLWFIDGVPAADDRLAGSSSPRGNSGNQSGRNQFIFVNRHLILVLVVYCRAKTLDPHIYSNVFGRVFCCYTNGIRSMLRTAMLMFPCEKKTDDRSSC